MSHAVRPSAAPAPISEPVSASETSALAERSYQGLVTRSIAFAIDGAIINVVAIVVGTGVALALSVLHLPQSLDPILVALGGASYLLWSIGYFVVLWSSTGETAGDRVMRIRVCMADGGAPPRPFRALVRLWALILAVIPLARGSFRSLWTSAAVGRTTCWWARLWWPPPTRRRPQPALASVGDDHLEQHQQQAQGGAGQATE